MAQLANLSTEWFYILLGEAPETSNSVRHRQLRRARDIAQVKGHTSRMVNFNVSLMCFVRNYFFLNFVSNVQGTNFMISFVNDHHDILCE